jgi:type IV pilus assembly protein PilA
MEKKMNNKGFSLVELIIVVAIMAVLIGVLAPTYLKYVESSKRTSDCTSIGSILDACEVLAIDPNEDWTGATISFNDTGACTISDADLIEITGCDSLTLQADWGAIEITAAKDTTTGEVTFTYVTAPTVDFGNYSDALDARIE